MHLQQAYVIKKIGVPIYDILIVQNALKQVGMMMIIVITKKYTLSIEKVYIQQEFTVEILQYRRTVNDGL